jgi:hypothetical protein
MATSARGVHAGPGALPAEALAGDGRQSAWRDAIGPEPLESLQQAVLAACCADHRDHDYRAVRVGGLRAGAIDGTLTRMPDTPANRAAYGSAGTADDSAPYPQLRSLLLTDASTRGTLGVVCGPCGGDKAEAEQKLLDNAMTEFACLFTGDRLWIMGRNFRAPRGVLAYRPRSGHGLEEVSVGLMAYLDP